MFSSFSERATRCFALVENSTKFVQVQVRRQIIPICTRPFFPVPIHGYRRRCFTTRFSSISNKCNGCRTNTIANLPNINKNATIHDISSFEESIMTIIEKKKTTGSQYSTVIQPIIRGRHVLNNSRNFGASTTSSSTRTMKLRNPTIKIKKRILGGDKQNKQNNNQQQNNNYRSNTINDNNNKNNDNNKQEYSSRFSSLLSSTRSSYYEYGSYPVTAINIAHSIDLSEVIGNVFATKGVKKIMERLSVVMQLRPKSEDDTSESDRFVAVFGYGSVVFFNVSPKETALLVQEIKRFSKGILPFDQERKERYCVHIQPAEILSSPTASTTITSDCGDDIGADVPPIHNGGNDNNANDLVTSDYCIVPELNMKYVDVISNIMAQSVALDAYNDKVDCLLADFERINDIVTLEGNLNAVDRNKLFQAVALNNSIFLRLTKVGIKDRVDTAWDLSQYEHVDEFMRKEFDIDQRFDYIEFKLNLIQQNAKFFLEVLANQKSDSLEYIIIVLISLECVLMCIEMSGYGGTLFAYLGGFVS